MTARTHDLSALTALNIIVATQTIPAVSLPTTIAVIGACFIGGLTPDIDKSTSEFWQKFPIGTIIGKIFHPFFGSHRLISHSVLGIVIFGIIAKFLLNLAGSTIMVDMNIVWYGFMVGLVSHIAVDLLTKEGAPLLFPLPFNFGIPPLKFFRIKTGGKIEKGLIFPLLFLINGLIFYNFYPIYLAFFRSLIK